MLPRLDAGGWVSSGGAVLTHRSCLSPDFAFTTDHSFGSDSEFWDGTPRSARSRLYDIVEAAEDVADSSGADGGRDVPADLFLAHLVQVCVLF